jgi:hypothetical protein
VKPLPFCCAKTVSEPDLLKPPELRFERKQIPRIVVNIRNNRKAMEPLEATKLPWAQLRASREYRWTSLATRQFAGPADTKILAGIA